MNYFFLYTLLVIITFIIVSIKLRKHDRFDSPGKVNKNWQRYYDMQNSLLLFSLPQILLVSVVEWLLKVLASSLFALAYFLLISIVQGLKFYIIYRGSSSRKVKVLDKIVNNSLKLITLLTFLGVLIFLSTVVYIGISWG